MRSATPASDHVGMPALQNGAHFGRFALPLGRELQQIRIGAAWERHFLDGVEFVSRLRHQIFFQADRSADNSDLRRGFKFANRPGDGE